MRKLTLMILTMLLLCAVNSTLLTVSSFAAIPKLINYQGRLSDSQGRPITGTKTVKFRLYDQQAGGTMLWEETQSVTIDKGVFNAVWGGVTALNLAFDKPYYLELVVEGEVFSPRQQLASSAYAFAAGNGVPRGAIIMWSGTIADIPSGWALCDGTNGTPDLRDKFVKGTPNRTTNPGNTGGNLSHTHTGTVHTHSYTTDEERNNWASGEARNIYIDITGNYGGGWHTVSGFSGSSGNVWRRLGGVGTQSGGGENTSAASSMPPYYEIAFIMKIE